MSNSPHEMLQTALRDKDAARLRSAFEQSPNLRARINDPSGPFNSPLVMWANTPAILDVMLEFGADINARSTWWAGGFGLLDLASDDLAEHALKRGARLDVHSAARLGKAEELRAILEADPLLVHARGGDGKTPLHFARNVEIARLLLAHGADQNALDVDHESSPAQYLIRECQEVSRFLVQNGCEADLFLAAALGDLELARKCLAARPDSIRLRINDAAFPMRNPKAGGSIYQWTLGFNLSPLDVALKFGHARVADFLRSESPPEVLLLARCWEGNDQEVRSLLGKNGGKLTFSPYEQRQLGDAARENNTGAVKLMLQAGLPLTSRGQHEATALHWGSWHGNLEMVNALISAGAPLEDSQNSFHATPLGWAMHGSENGWHRKLGNYPGVVRALLRAGAKRPVAISGTAEVRKELEQAG